MPEPLNDDCLKTTQQIIIDLPPGPWEIQPNEHGLPDQVGPIAFLETWVDSERVPVIEFIAFAREALPRYLGEVSRQRDEIRDLKRRLKQLEGGAGHDR